MQNLTSFVLIIISELLISTVGILIFRNKNSKSQIKNVFLLILFLMFIWTTSLILQLLFQSSSVDPFVFEKIAGFGAFFIPVAFILLAQSFVQTKFRLARYHIFLLIIPIITTLLALTNQSHHLLVVSYSTNINETVWGPYFPIHAIYTYLLYGISLFTLISYSIKNSGFFSRQSLLIISGTLIAIIINLLGTLRIVPMTVYITPISFAFALFFWSIAIFKFKFLQIAPIALSTIVNSMSDSYLILNDELIVTDFNETLLKTFSIGSDFVRNKSFFDLVNHFPNLKINKEKISKLISESKANNSTITLESYFKDINKYFKVEITSIMNHGIFLGTLVLFKDTTQHNIDMQTIKNNQEILVEKERLSSLGQMIGGIAHNLKTPIMSIAGAMEGLSDLVKEYDMSIGDSEVTEDDHHEIAHDMTEWIEKTRTHLSYMSDIITAVKGQAVAFSDNMFNGFTVEELVKHVDILMKHELKNALIDLKTNVSLDPRTEIAGNINSLVQVINNIISNAIQAYKGKPNQDILFNLYEENHNLVVAIQDFAGGLPLTVQKKLFKEMITTKGKNGTGLGLFMSYSNIKAHFNGSLDYETKDNEGTTFYIRIPIS